ncbi:MAG: hypothetical protein WC959_11350 [Kiritimatiellales bacterium]
MSARQSNLVRKEFYEQLVQDGKKKTAALIAVSRKLIILTCRRLADPGSSSYKLQ